MVTKLIAEIEKAGLKDKPPQLNVGDSVNVHVRILEGDKDTVLALLKSIAQDTRHNSLKVFSELEVDELTFHRWRMAYLDATPEQLSAWAGLAGAATIAEILADIDQDPQRVAGVARGILQALGT